MTYIFSEDFILVSPLIRLGDVRAERAQAIIYLIFLIFSSSLSCALERPKIENRISYIEKREKDWSLVFGLEANRGRSSI